MVAGGDTDAVIERPGSSVDPTVALPIELDPTRQGPGCLGGLCMDMIPDAIAVGEVPAYLAVLRNGLAAEATPEAANACHSIAHEIGRRAAEQGPVSALLDLDDGRCLYGYQHGVLEGWSSAVDLATLVAGIPTACAAYDDGGTSGGLGGGEVEYARGSCAHGIGHAIALQGVGSVAEAVQYCDGAGSGNLTGCAGGVFMAYADENPSQGEYAPKQTLTLTRSEVLELCGTLQGAYREECWSKMWLLGQRVGVSPSEVAALCPDTDAPQCGRGVGEGLLYQYGLEVSEALEGCPARIEPYCLYGVAWSNANVWVGAGNRAETYTSVCPTQPSEVAAACRESELAALAGAVR